jgi:hypothetical protein
MILLDLDYMYSFMAKSSILSIYLEPNLTVDARRTAVSAEVRITEQLALGQTGITWQF